MDNTQYHSEIIDVGHKTEFTYLYNVNLSFILYNLHNKVF